MMSNLIQNIQEYTAKSAELLQDEQISCIPTLAEDQIEYAVKSYLFDNKRILTNQGYELCLKLKYLRFVSKNPKVIKSYINIKGWFVSLVNDKVIQPFIVFMNGRFIPWEIMYISICDDCAYLTINSAENDKFMRLVQNVRFVQILNLPGYISYKNRVSANDALVFAFNDEGVFDTKESEYNFYYDGFYNRDQYPGKDVIFNTFTTNTSVNAYPIVENTSVKLSDKNVILFKDGLFATGNVENIKKTIDTDVKSEDGRVAPCLNIYTDDIELDENPSIKFDSTFLTINNGENKDGSTYNFLVFINSNFSETADNIAKIPLVKLSDDVKKSNAGQETSEYFEDLKTQFEFSMDRNKDYSTNIADAIKYMISYDSSIFNQTFYNNSNLIIETYIYDEAFRYNMLKDDGTVVIPMKRGDNLIDEAIIMLVNGELYAYNKMIKYKANRCIIPISGIEEGDMIEFLRFQNINNIVTDITINESDKSFKYSDDIVNDNMILFSSTFYPDESKGEYEAFTFPEDGLQHFPVDYELEYDDNEGVKITLTNPEYYGKPLKLAHKNRFSHFCFTLSETTDKYTINLGDKFMYCNDYSRYLVFYNGRRLNSDYYRLTLPVRPTTPFSTFDIYLTMPVKEGDQLDIFYTPSLIQDVVFIPEVDMSGDIVIDKSILNYGFSTNLYMVWINGKKIPATNIVDIDSTHMRIISDEQTTKMLCITKYIPDIDEITEAFKENQPLWDKILSKLDNSQISALLEIPEGSLTDNEQDIYDGAVNIEAIMYELVREQYLMNPRVDVTGSFVYDYQDVDKTIIEAYDSEENALLTVADGNKQDNLDNVTRPWP